MQNVLRHIGLRHFSALFVFTCLTILSTLMSGSAYAKSTSPAFPMSNCGVTSITLNGDQPATTTCITQTQSLSTSASPAVNATACTSGWNLFIEDINASAYCFYGTGYFPYRINNVIAYLNEAYPSWVRIYPNGSTSGCYYTMPAYTTTYYDAYFNGAHSITQVYVNGTKNANVC